MNPIDYTLEEWIDLWQEAHADDGLTFTEYLKQSAEREEELPTLSDFDFDNQTTDRGDSS